MATTTVGYPVMGVVIGLLALALILTILLLYHLKRKKPCCLFPRSVNTWLTEQDQLVHKEFTDNNKGNNYGHVNPSMTMESEVAGHDQPTASPNGQPRSDEYLTDACSEGSVKEDRRQLDPAYAGSLSGYSLAKAFDLTDDQTDRAHLEYEAMATQGMELVTIKPEAMDTVGMDSTTVDSATMDTVTLNKKTMDAVGADGVTLDIETMDNAELNTVTMDSEYVTSDALVTDYEQTDAAEQDTAAVDPGTGHTKTVCPVDDVSIDTVHKNRAENVENDPDLQDEQYDNVTSSRYLVMTRSLENVGDYEDVRLSQIVICDEDESQTNRNKVQKGFSQQEDDGDVDANYVNTIKERDEECAYDVCEQYTRDKQPVFSSVPNSPQETTHNPELGKITTTANDEFQLNGSELEDSQPLVTGCEEDNGRSSPGHESSQLETLRQQEVGSKSTVPEPLLKSSKDLSQKSSKSPVKPPGGDHTRPPLPTLRSLRKQSSEDSVSLPPLSSQSSPVTTNYSPEDQPPPLPTEPPPALHSPQVPTEPPPQVPTEQPPQVLTEQPPQVLTEPPPLPTRQPPKLQPPEIPTEPPPPIPTRQPPKLQPPEIPTEPPPPLPTRQPPKLQSPEIPTEPPPPLPTRQPPKLQSPKMPTEPPPPLPTRQPPKLQSPEIPTEPPPPLPTRQPSECQSPGVPTIPPARSQPLEPKPLPGLHPPPHAALLDVSDEEEADPDESADPSAESNWYLPMILSTEDLYDDVMNQPSVCSNSDLRDVGVRKRSVDDHPVPQTYEQEVYEGGNVNPKKRSRVMSEDSQSDDAPDAQVYYDTHDSQGAKRATDLLSGYHETEDENFYEPINVRRSGLINMKPGENSECRETEVITRPRCPEPNARNSTASTVRESQLIYDNIDESTMRQSIKDETSGYEQMRVESLSAAQMKAMLFPDSNKDPAFINKDPTKKLIATSGSDKNPNAPQIPATDSNMGDPSSHSLRRFEGGRSKDKKTPGSHSDHDDDEDDCGWSGYYEDYADARSAAGQQQEYYDLNHNTTDRDKGDTIDVRGTDGQILYEDMDA